MSNTNNLMVYIQCDENTPINASLEALSKGVELGKENNLDVIAVLIGKFDENTEKICKDYGANKIIEADVEQYKIVFSRNYTGCKRCNCICIFKAGYGKFIQCI